MSTRGHWGRTRVTADDLHRSLGGPTRLRGVTVPCLRFEEARRFYIDRLGLRLSGQSRSHAVLESGGVRLVLVDARKSGSFQRGVGQGLYLELQVADLDAVLRRLEAGGIRPPATRDTASGRLLTLVDPEGNLVNLVQPTRGG